MDIKRSQSNKKKYKNFIFIGITVLITGLLTIGFFKKNQRNTTIELSALWHSDVKQKDLALMAKGFGILASKKQRYLTAPFTAVVEEILLKPGAKVTEDSVILILSNPDISQAVNQAQLSLNAEQSNLKQLKLNQLREQLDVDNDLLELNLDLNVAKSKLNAETDLADKGIVSALDFMRTQAQVKKLTGRHNHFTQRNKQLLTLHKQAQQIQQDKINEKRNLLSLAENKRNQLTVKAGIKGVLQALPVELGQSLTIGSQLALVGSTEKLIALINIPHRQVQGVKENMPTTIDTRGSIAHGKVTRIEPIVKEGHVEVEIELFGSLPSNARPALNIEAAIDLGMIKKALYIEAPINAIEHSSVQVFKIKKDKQSAELIWLTLGHKVGAFMQIKSGADVGDTLILSDMSHHFNQSNIALIH